MSIIIYHGSLTVYASIDSAPQIFHVKPNRVGIDDQKVTFLATITDADGLANVDGAVLYWRVDPKIPYTKTIMQNISSTNDYIAEVQVKAFIGTPKETKVLFTDKLEYYIQATDTFNQISVHEDIIEVEQYWGQTDRYQYIPPILITEMQPDTNNIPNRTNPSANADGYEFIEIYNNTNQPINLSSYEFRYMNNPSSSNPGAHVVQNPDVRDVILEPQSAFVIWIVNDQLQDRTLDDFYQNYYGSNNIEGIPFVENENIGYVHFGGMPNGGQHRGWGIYTNTGELVVEAYYNILNNTNNDTTNDRSIFFQYPSNGGKRMQKVSANVYRGNPGIVLDYQVPQYAVNVAKDNEPPVITYMHTQNVLNASYDFELWVSVTDDVKTTSLYLYYQLSSPSFTPDSYQRVNFKRDGDTFFYNAIIDRAEFIRQSSLTFYIEASDGVGNVTRTQLYTSVINQSESPIGTGDIRANINPNDSIGGLYNLLVSSDEYTDDIRMYLDGIELSPTQPSLERMAYFVYEVIETDYWFMNGVSINQHVLFNFEISGRWTSYVVAIPLKELSKGLNTISLHSGNRYNTFYDPQIFNQGVVDWNNGVNSVPGWQQKLTYGDNTNNTHPAVIAAGLNLNRDDYRFRDVRLILPDGTLVFDSNYSNREIEYNIGDSGTVQRVYDFNFLIEDGMFNSVIHTIDTKALDNGSHTLYITNGVHSQTIPFFVDNEKPVIHMNFEPGAELKGIISIDPELFDYISGIGIVEAYFNDQLINLPYITASGLLDEGMHTLRIKVYDKVGNYSEIETYFTTPFERPNEPVFSLSEGTVLEGNVAVMQVMISDPTNDQVKVSFYQGYRYSANELDMFKGYHNIIDHEPPTYIYAPGETSFNQDDYERIKSIDGNYFSNEGIDLPYQRFEIQLDPYYDGYDQIKVRWVGHSYEGRSVTLYAWNFELEKYDILSRKIAGNSDFELIGYLIPRKYIDEFSHKAYILIQDEFEPEKFTFVWTTDTQYYAQRNSYDDEDHVIFEQQMDWILANREQRNLKYVIHTGDIVNAFQEYQWTLADRYLGKLDSAKMPYGVLAGNHDVKFTENDYTLYYKYFGEHRFYDKPWYGESYSNNRGHYDLINVYGYEFMIVYIGWTIEQAGIDWMNRVISANPSKMVILATHDYLGTGGQRSLEGDKLFQEVVVKHSNIRLVLSGHYHGAARRYDDIDDDGDGHPDRRVFQVLHDYQGLPNTASNYEGGNGFLRLMEFDPQTEQLTFKTYSPWLEYINRMNGYNENHPQYLNPHFVFPNLESERDQYGYRDEFTIPWSLSVSRKLVATDYVSVNIMKNTLYSESGFLPSHSQFETTWSDLEFNKRYYWYAVVQDENMGMYVSNLYSFRTGLKPTEESLEGSWGIYLALASSLLVISSGAGWYIIRKKRISK